MKKYYRDYERDAHGIRYTGDVYVFPVENGEKKKILLKNAGCCVLYILLIILAGLVNNSGGRSFFLVLPYAFLFLPCAYLLMGVLAVPGLAKEMEKAAYDRAIGRMFRSAVGILVLSLYLTVADSVYLLRQKDLESLRPVDETVFLCACIAVFAVSCVQMWHLQNIRKKVMIWKRDEGVPIGK